MNPPNAEDSEHSTKDRPAPSAERPTAGGRFWMAVPLVLLGSMLVGWGYMVAIALDDPSFSVERDYYRKGVRWEEHQAQLAVNARLGWSLTAALVPRAADTEVAVRLLDRRGEPVPGAQVAVETFPVARGDQLVAGTLAEGEAGEYRAGLPLRRRGLWELRFTATRGTERFTATLRRDLGGPS